MKYDVGGRQLVRSRPDDCIDVYGKKGANPISGISTVRRSQDRDPDAEISESAGGGITSLCEEFAFGAATSRRVVASERAENMRRLKKKENTAKKYQFIKGVLFPLPFLLHSLSLPSLALSLLSLFLVQCGRIMEKILIEINMQRV